MCVNRFLFSFRAERAIFGSCNLTWILRGRNSRLHYAIYRAVAFIFEEMKMHEFDANHFLPLNFWGSATSLFFLLNTKWEEKDAFSLCATKDHFVWNPQATILPTLKGLFVQKKSLESSKQPLKKKTFSWHFDDKLCSWVFPSLHVVITRLRRLITQLFQQSCAIICAADKFWGGAWEEKEVLTTPSQSPPSNVSFAQQV